MAVGLFGVSEGGFAIKDQHRDPQGMARDVPRLDT